MTFKIIFVLFVAGVVLFFSAVAEQPVHAYYEDFEDAGNLDGTLYGSYDPSTADPVVSGGILNTDYVDSGFLANGDYADFSGYITFNFGGDTYEWNEAVYVIGSDGSSGPPNFAYALAGVMVQYLPQKGWMYILQEWKTGDTWSTIYLDQTGVVSPAGFSNTTDYELHVIDNGNGTLDAWVQEAANPANKGHVYTSIDISGATFYGDKVAASGGFAPGVGGIKDFNIGSTGGLVGNINTGDGIEVRKGGVPDTYLITITEAPPTNPSFPGVRVFLDVDELEGQIEVDPSNPGTFDPNNALDILFTSSNWATPVTVTVTAVDDTGSENLTLHHSLVYVDSDYVADPCDPQATKWSNPFLANSSVPVIVTQLHCAVEIDVLNPNGIVVSEQGPTSDTYTVSLKQEPGTISTVQVDITTDSQISVDPVSLIFNNSDWEMPQTVTVTAVDDTVGDNSPDVAYISHSISMDLGPANTLFSDDFEDGVLTWNGFANSNYLSEETTDQGGVLRTAEEPWAVAPFNLSSYPIYQITTKVDLQSVSEISIFIRTAGTASVAYFGGAPAGIRCVFGPSGIDDGFVPSIFHNDNTGEAWMCLASGGPYGIPGFDSEGIYKITLTDLGSVIVMRVEDENNPANYLQVVADGLYGINYGDYVMMGCNRNSEYTDWLDFQISEPITPPTSDQVKWIGAAIEYNPTVSITDNDCRSDRAILKADFDRDCDVDLADFVFLAAEFLDCTLPNVEGCNFPPTALDPRPDNPELIRLPVNSGPHHKEHTPIIFNSIPMLVQNYTGPFYAGTCDDESYLYIENLYNGEELTRFGYGFAFVSAYVEDNVFHIYATENTCTEWTKDVYHFWSTDLQTWQDELVIARDGGEHLFNTSVCKGPDGYIMTYESNTPVQWCFKIARSMDLWHWEKKSDLIFADLVNHTVLANPTIRYISPYYYIIFGTHRTGWPVSDYEFHSPTGIYFTCILRSKDLITWDLSPTKYPMIDPVAGDGINTSDADLFEYEGNTYVTYMTGDQSSWGTTRIAMYAGPMKECLEAYFPPNVPTVKFDASQGKYIAP
ncbi:MAG: hypothetical protein JXD22_13615 [Sedimentisphaerales bacterium]|nr:hypothetical protein [Sedimentisphaerales bacterium]